MLGYIVVFNCRINRVFTAVVFLFARHFDQFKFQILVWVLSTVVIRLGWQWISVCVFLV
jgi:hypothetical protein